MIISEDKFDALMEGLGPYEDRPYMAVAVSGGADSLCLALFAGRWAERRGGRVVGLTVDHGLRPEAGDEALQVGRWLEGLGIEHRVLKWTGPKPVSGIQAAARRARYQLMSSWCREKGFLHLLLGHTGDDQAETLLLRLGSGSGPDGLAAMSAIRETPDVRILRPWLGVAKQDLVETLTAQGQKWIEDPSNQDHSFARVRVRKAMKDGGFRPKDLALAAHRFGRARQVTETEASRLLARVARVHPAGFAELQCAPLVAAPDEISLRALSRVLIATGGRDYAPKLAKLERLHGEFFSHPSASDGRSMTLAGCHVTGKGDKILICRENRGVPEPALVHSGERVIWDGRFNILMTGQRVASVPASGAEGAFLGGLGPQGWSEVVQMVPDLRRTAVPATARHSLPALFDGFGVYSVPHLGFRRDQCKGPMAGFLPVTGPNFREILFSPANALSSTGFFLRSGPDILSL
ncbi:MAG: tRNA lysidine(34) synthetase TilS [Rhodospirillales bacterium]